MAGIDKAAIVFSMAIALIGVGIAVAGSTIDYSPSVSTPTASTITPAVPKATSSYGADLAAKVKEDAGKMDEKKVEEKTNQNTEMKSVKVEEKVNMEETQEEKTMMKKPAGPTTHDVDIPAGTSTPGCESNNSCFSPADITINAGDTVNWINVDTAAHTVTGGSPADGPSGVFDSSLVMGKASFAFTFDDKGSFDYFCMVHPWMTGSVTVN